MVGPSSEHRVKFDRLTHKIGLVHNTLIYLYGADEVKTVLEIYLAKLYTIRRDFITDFPEKKTTRELFSIVCHVMPDCT